jgi:hypothetical protein
MKLFIYILLLYPINLYATTYLCIGETGAGVENTGAGGFKSQVYSVSNQKFALSNNSGSWLLKKIGQDHPVFDQCESEYMCQSKEGYSGIFLRGGDGVFTYALNQAYGAELQKEIMLTVKGLCSRL